VVTGREVQAQQPPYALPEHTPKPGACEIRVVIAGDGVKDGGILVDHYASFDSGIWMFGKGH
jgi:hypothetical protein